MKLSEAKSVTLELLDVNGGSDERTPVGSTVRWTFPARGDTPEIKVHLWEGNRAGPDGKNQVPNHPPIAAELEKQYNRQFDKSWGGGGTLYLGDKGIMYTANYGSGPRIVPEAHKAFPMPPASIPRVKGGHFGDFLRACKDGQPSSADFSYAGPFTEFVLMAQLALKAGIGRKVEYDIANMQCTNVPELNRWVKREYRKGWEV